MLQITKGLPATIYKVALRTLAGAISTPLLIIPESTTQPGFYSVDIPTNPQLPPGKYRAFYYREAGGITEFLGTELIQWDGTNVVVELATAQQLSQIKENAIAARQLASNNVDIDRDLATVTVLADDGLATLFKFQMLDEFGNPSIDNAVSRVRIITP